MPSSALEWLDNCLLDQFYFMSHCIINLLFKGAQSIQFWTMIQLVHIINVLRCYSGVHWTLFSIWSIRPVEDIDFCPHQWCENKKNSHPYRIIRHYHPYEYCATTFCFLYPPSRENKIEQGWPGSPLAPSEGAFELTHGSACILGGNLGSWII